MKVEKLEKKRAALMSSIDKLKKAALVKGKKQNVLGFKKSEVIHDYHPPRLREQGA